MKQSLGMDTNNAEQAAGQADGQNPQDVEMVVDAVADTNPVSQSTLTVQEQYPDCQYSDDLLYRVTFANKAETNIKVEVEFSLIDANVPVNLSYPTGGLVDYLKPGQTGTLMTLAKTNPLGEPTNMGNLRIEVKTSTHADHDFNMNGFSSQTDVPGAKELKGKTSTSGGAASSIKD